MAKINIEEAKKRLQKPQTFAASNIFKTEKPKEIEYIDTVNDNMFMFKVDDIYVLSPADDTLDPVIGEFDEISEDGSMPPCLQDWLDTYQKEINFFEENEVDLILEEPKNEIKYGQNLIKLVDLGLSVKWADVNIGTITPEGKGFYFAWGETAPKTSYTIENYKYYNASTKTYIDLGKNISKTNFDIAYNFDKNLCIPTETQFQELIDKCTWTKTTLNNLEGWEVKGPNGNTIFLPLNGCKSESSKTAYTNYCYLWTANSIADNTPKAKTFRITDKPGFYSMYRRTGAGLRAVSSIEKNIARKHVDPIIPYKWSQGSPYNSLLPIDPSTKSKVITGCTQTAFAMILAYYANYGVNGQTYRHGMNKTEAYTSSKNGIKINIPALPSVSMFDYDNMNFNTSAEIKKSVERINAVAKLMKHIGFANYANYSSGATGATPEKVMKTAKDKMHIASNPEIIYASSGIELFKENIYKELEQGYPVLLSGWNNSGTSGHTFICDGYNPETDKFHFNWGWSGSYNGWFDISILKPGNYDFSYSKRALVNLHPDFILGDINEDGKISIVDVTTLVNVILKSPEFNYKYDLNFDGEISQADIELLVDKILQKKLD